MSKGKLFSISQTVQILKYANSRDLKKTCLGVLSSLKTLLYFRNSVASFLSQSRHCLQDRVDHKKISVQYCWVGDVALEKVLPVMCKVWGRHLVPQSISPTAKQGGPTLSFGILKQKLSELFQWKVLERGVLTYIEHWTPKNVHRVLWT